MELAGPIKFCLSVQKEALINVPLLLFVSKLGELDVSALLVFFLEKTSAFKSRDHLFQFRPNRVKYGGV